MAWTFVVFVAVAARRGVGRVRCEPAGRRFLRAPIGSGVAF